MPIEVDIKSYQALVAEESTPTQLKHFQNVTLKSRISQPKEEIALVRLL